MYLKAVMKITDHNIKQQALPTNIKTILWPCSKLLKIEKIKMDQF